ncbi:FprA family A-type flavoprotein [Heliophilum fasciatum]|uniref:Flavorubredoxin n=1 Tax=Heliophilum fasciatum TaxID=35700 RepID=A0A4R2RZR7_9FIRM|nr:FprA family A-type flavoprotein [Heliophilum fasciatum]MCW2276911.1 flavorubredoxin [Heliophilum fasciatum]TCP68629.1 flavorubredoxin [Heliophilum fasciatum]
MKPIKLKDNVYWVGAIDWDLREFHGYLTQRGSTYNAYLIIDEKITLIDTVKHYLTDEMLERISHLVDPAKIDYIVCNHIEMDHSGSVPRMMELAPNATICTSVNGAKTLKAHFKKDYPVKVIKSGDSLSIGQKTLNFVHTQMVHWPDSMVTYLAEDKILFSNDAFGQHYASSERFDDELSSHIVIEEARKYYANIVLPYGMQVQKALAAVEKMDIDMIATSHGAIWRTHVREIIEEYKKWAANITKPKAVIVYDTMWGSTDLIARSLARVFEEKDIQVRMCILTSNHISDIMTDLIEAKYICVGSPTLNNNMLPTVAGFLAYLKGLAPKNRTALAFGSYGWGGQSIQLVDDMLKSCGFDMLEQVRVNYIPDEAELQAIRERVQAAIN